MQFPRTVYAVAGIYAPPPVDESIRIRLMQAISECDAVKATEEEIEKCCKARAHARNIAIMWNVLWDIFFASLVITLVALFNIANELASIFVFAFLLSTPLAVIVGVRLFSAYPDASATAVSGVFRYYVARVLELVFATLAVASILAFFGFLQLVPALDGLLSIVERSSSLLNRQVIGEHCRTPIGYLFNTVANCLFAGVAGIVSFSASSAPRPINR